MKNKKLLVKVLKKKMMSRTVTLGLTSHEIDEKVYRAHQDIICKQCGEPYHRHPLVGDELSKIDGEPYLNVLCSGDIVKL